MSLGTPVFLLERKKLIEASNLKLITANQLSSSLLEISNSETL